MSKAKELMDMFDAVTRSYIEKNRSKLVDNIFQSSPLWAMIKEEEEKDEFTKFAEWAAEVRGESPPESIAGGRAIHALAEWIDSPIT